MLPIVCICIIYWTVYCVLHHLFKSNGKTDTPFTDITRSAPNSTTLPQSQKIAPSTVRRRRERWQCKNQPLERSNPIVGVFCASFKTVDPPPLDTSRSLSKLKIHEIQGLAGDFLSITECLNYQPDFVVDGRRTEKITKEGDPFPTSRGVTAALKKPATRANSAKETVPPPWKRRLPPRLFCGKASLHRMQGMKKGMGNGRC